MGETAPRAPTLVLARTADGAERAMRWVRGDAVVVLGDDVAMSAAEPVGTDVVIDVPDSDPAWLHSAIAVSRVAVSPGHRLLLVLTTITGSSGSVAEVFGEALQGLTVRGVSTNGASVGLSMGPGGDGTDHDLTGRSVVGAMRLAKMLLGIMAPAGVGADSFEADEASLTSYLADVSHLRDELATARRDIDGLRAPGPPPVAAAVDRSGPAVVDPPHPVRRSPSTRMRRVAVLIAAVAGWVAVTAAIVGATSLQVDAVPGLLGLGLVMFLVVDVRRRFVNMYRRVIYLTAVAEQSRTRTGQLRDAMGTRHEAIRVVTNRAANAADRTVTLAREAAADAVLRHEAQRVALDRLHDQARSNEIAALAPTIRRAVNYDLMTLYRQIEANVILRDAVDVTGPTPPLRGWAASPDVIALLVRELRIHRPTTIVECGSGASTAWLAMACRTLNLPARVISLEHDEHFASATRELVAGCGVEHLVDVRCAPLEPVVLADFEGSWYSPQLIEGLTDVGLVFVDGPPADTNPLARFPALPMLYPHLADRVTIVLDDTIRAEERLIASRWSEWAPGLVTSDHPLEKGAIVLRRTSRSDPGPPIDLVPLPEVSDA